MNRLLRQNPFLRIALFFGIGVYLLNNQTLFYSQLFICLSLSIICYFKRAKILESLFIASLIALSGSAQQFMLLPEEKKTFIQDKPQSKYQGQILNEEHRQLYQDFLAKHDSSTAGLMVALLIGETKYIQQDTKNTYKNLGLSHLLAVSGMHIGLIFQTIFWILNFITIKKTPKITTLAGLCFIWWFTHIGQYSPSLLRASIMFTAMYLGKMFDQKCNALNALSFSFIIVLICFPELQFHWGFILSHLAVLGIVLHHRRWQQITLNIKKIPKWMVQNLAVTWNAQLYTSLFLLPITLSFPTYFLISNFVLVPLFSILLFSIFFEWISLLFSIPIPLDQLNNLLFGGVNTILLKLNELPFLQLKWSLTWSLTLLIIILIIILYWLFLERKTKSLILTIALALNLIMITHHYQLASIPPEIHLWKEHGQKKRLWTHQSQGCVQPNNFKTSNFLLQKGVKTEQSP